MKTDLQNRETRVYSDIDYKLLERSYRRGGVWRSFVLSITAATLILMAFSMFGDGVDREKLTSQVTPVHIQLGTVSDRHQTADDLRSLQL